MIRQLHPGGMMEYRPPRWLRLVPATAMLEEPKDPDLHFVVPNGSCGTEHLGQVPNHQFG